jgi:hypothetical protein
MPKRLAVGFARIDEDNFLTSASDAPPSDGRFITRGARISVSGASGAPQDPSHRRTVELLTMFSYFDGAELREAPFRAWGCSRTTGCQGNTVRFNVPVDLEQRVRFNVGVESGATGSATTRRRAIGGGSGADAKTLPVTLSLRDEKDAFRLTRGIFVIVPLFENDAEPQWSLWRIGRAGGRLAMVDRDGTPAPFEHFVLHVDLAP